MESNRKRIVLANSLEFVCSAMNSKVYYSCSEQKRINHRKEIINQIRQYA